MTAQQRLLYACFLAWSGLALWACGDEFETAESTGPSADCPGDASVPCEQDPWNCAAGQTCSYNQAGDGMQCLNAGPGGEGEACVPAIGSPECAELHLCVGDGNGGGTCRQYCDPSTPCKACPGELVCRGVTFSNGTTGQPIATTNVCLPQGS